MHILVFGLNHNTAPIDVRERFFVSEDKLEALLKTLKEKNLNESVVLSTCNRTEVYLAIKHPHEGISILKEILSETLNAEIEWLDKYTYTFIDEDAYGHLFSVASGLDSMVIGEPQILGQVKDAYRAATFLGTTGFYLNRLFHRAFHVAKRVRTETKIGYNPVSISSMAVELSRHIFGDLSNKKILVIGAGEMCEIALKHFKKEGLKEIYITNRTFEKAKALSEIVSGKPCRFEELSEFLTRVDMVLSSTGADNYIIKKEDMIPVMKKRKNRPIFFIDIAMPRDIEPGINDFENIYLYNIDDLKELSAKYLKNRLKESEYAKTIINDEIVKFSQWLRQLETHPLITHVVDRAELIRSEEFNKMIKKIKHLDDDTIKNIEVLTKNIVNKIIHPHLLLIKKERRPEILELVKKLFNYENDAEEKMDNRHEG